MVLYVLYYIVLYYIILYEIDLRDKYHGSSITGIQNKAQDTLTLLNCLFTV
jgi:hypothetical protein